MFFLRRFFYSVDLKFAFPIEFGGPVKENFKENERGGIGDLSLFI